MRVLLLTALRKQQGRWSSPVQCVFEPEVHLPKNNLHMRSQRSDEWLCETSPGRQAFALSSVSPYTSTVPIKHRHPRLRLPPPSAKSGAPARLLAAAAPAPVSQEHQAASMAAGLRALRCLLQLQPPPRPTAKARGRSCSDTLLMQAQLLL